ncbi:thioredoxin, partial [Pantoea endophytica]
RKNGIHVSPTFITDVLVQLVICSGEEIESWAERILA